MIFTQLVHWINSAWQGADALVAFEAQRQGISKADAWAGAGAAAQFQGDQALELIADLLDPLGWRAAASALNQAA
jgi:hypothetical protein